MFSGCFAPVRGSRHGPGIRAGWNPFNRYARIPALRINAINMIPTTDMDIERIELARGPGSRCRANTSVETTGSTRDPWEVRARAEDPDHPRIGVRNPLNERFFGDVRADYRFADDGEFIVSGGLNNSLSSINLTSVGSSQTHDCQYRYGQARPGTGSSWAPRNWAGWGW